jgi:hypothetical protein
VNSRVEIQLIDPPDIMFEREGADMAIDVIVDQALDLSVSPENLGVHGLLSGLDADDHPQYLNQQRADLRYEKDLGLPPADGYMLTSTITGVRSWVIPSGGSGGPGTEYHNALLGLQGGESNEYYHLNQGVHNAFQYMPNGGNPYLRVLLPIACDYDVMAYADSGHLPGSIWDNMPYATAQATGGIRLSGAAVPVRFLREDGNWTEVSGGGGGSMVYPGAGIVRSAGGAWAAPLADNSSGWNEAALWVSSYGASAVSAYSWGDHGTEGYLKAITKAMIEAQLTGSITSHSHPEVKMANFTILQESGRLVIKHGTTVVLSISSTGELIVGNEVTAFGTP